MKLRTFGIIEIYLKIVVNIGSMNQDHACEAAKRHIIDACVQSAKIKGYSDACGVLRGTLFLADQPLSLDDLVELTGYSKSTVCLNMNILENLGLAKRVVVPRDKRSRYVTVSDPDSMKAIMLSNIRREIHLIINALDLTDRDLPGGGADEGRIRSKIAAMSYFYKQIDELLDLMGRFTTEELIDLLRKVGD
jgi:DNA-binding transcriptional regulator GbsR (MarR family)